MRQSPYSYGEELDLQVGVGSRKLHHQGIVFMLNYCGYHVLHTSHTHSLFIVEYVADGVSRFHADEAGGDEQTVQLVGDMLTEHTVTLIIGYSSFLLF